MNKLKIRLFLNKIKRKIYLRLLKIKINKKIMTYLHDYIHSHEGQGFFFDLAAGDKICQNKHEIDSCLSLLKSEPKIFIDIGCHEGEYTNFLFKKFPNLEVHIFEPSKVSFENLTKLFLNKNFFLNNLALANVNKRGMLFYPHPGSSLASLTKRDLRHTNIKFDLSQEIDVIRFDKYWNKGSSVIDYVKIDVEGHELDVLEGFGLYINNVRLIQFEFGPSNIDTRTYFRDFWYFFSENNFLIYRMTPLGNVLINAYEREKEEKFFFTNFIDINKKFL